MFLYRSSNQIIEMSVIKKKAFFRGRQYFWSVDGWKISSVFLPWTVWQEAYDDMQAAFSYA